MSVPPLLSLTADSPGPGGVPEQGGHGAPPAQGDAEAEDGQPQRQRVLGGQGQQEGDGPHHGGQVGIGEVW